MSIDTPPIAKYYQVAAHLKERITKGDLQPGDQLPTEESLVERFNVSRGTVRKAIRLLIDEDLVESAQGRGSFVTHAIQNTSHFSLSSFAEEMRRQQRKPSTRLLNFATLPAAESIAKRLMIAEGSHIFRIERLRLADGIPVAYECRTLAQSLCPELAAEDVENQSVHWLLTYKYKIPLVKMVHTMERLPLQAWQAELLDTTPDKPAFAVDRLSFTLHNGETAPAVLFEAVYREDSYYLTKGRSAVSFGLK